jgi:uncharacterized protein (DUF1330 family)
MTIEICVLLWATDGCEADLVAYEDTVLALIPRHGGQVASRVRRVDRDEGPFEMQIIHFPNQDAVNSYMNDPVRQALADVHRTVIARTDVIPVEVVV